MDRFFSGILQGFGFVLIVTACSLAYASMSHPNLPNVVSTSPVSASAWNDLVSYANKAVKQDTEIVTVTGGNLNVAGRVKISWGSPGDGKVIVSDSVWLGNWGYPKTPFSAVTPVATAIPANTWTIVKMSDQNDPYNFFDPVSNRFQPTVSGYYRVSALAQYSGNANAGGAHTLYLYLRKNGSSAFGSSFLHDGGFTGAYSQSLSVDGLLYMNWTTDYIDFQFIDNAYTGNVSATANMIFVSP